VDNLLSSKHLQIASKKYSQNVRFGIHHSYIFRTDSSFSPTTTELGFTLESKIYLCPSKTRFFWPLSVGFRDEKLQISKINFGSVFGKFRFRNAATNLQKQIVWSFPLFQRRYLQKYRYFSALFNTIALLRPDSISYECYFKRWQ
jgi:hypothetical protein